MRILNIIAPLITCLAILVVATSYGILLVNQGQRLTAVEADYNYLGNGMEDISRIAANNDRNIMVWVRQLFIDAELATEESFAPIPGHENLVIHYNTDK